MTKKIGKVVIPIVFDQETLPMLIALCDKTGRNRSEVVRACVKHVFKEFIEEGLYEKDEKKIEKIAKIYKTEKENPEVVRK